MIVMKSIRMIFLGASVLALAACATTSDSKNGSGGAGGADGANASAMGNNTSFGDGSGSMGENGNAMAMKVGNQRYYFDFDRSEVREVDKASIKVQANYLIAHPKAKVLVAGNTDNRGSREYNIGLGNRRALSVADILQMDGVSKNQITTVSYGAEKPVALGNGEDSWQQNRRGDLVYQTAVE